MTTTPYGIASLTGELKKLTHAVKGNRNITLNEVWFKLSQLVEAGHIDKLDAAQRVYQVAAQIGLPDSEIRATMASAGKGGAGKPRPDLPEPRPAAPAGGYAFDQPGGAPDGATSTEAPASLDELYLTRSELKGLPRPRPLLEGVIDEHALFAVTGRDRSYKSFLVLDWLACLATGKKWLDHEAHQARGLYVVGEGAYGLDERLTAWETAWQTVIGDEWLHIRRAPVNLFRQGYDCSELLARIEREQYGVIIFDTLQRMSSGADSNNARDAGIIIASMDYLRRAGQATAVGIVAHTGKTDEDLRGSSAFEDDLDCVWRIKRDEDAQVITARLDKRKDGPEGLTVSLRPQTIKGTGSIILTLAQGGEPDRPVEGKPLDTLKVLARDRVGDGRGMSPTEIEHRTKAPRTSVYRVLDWLQDQGYVSWTQGGRSRIYKISDQGVSALERIGEMPDDQHKRD